MKAAKSITNLIHGCHFHQYIACQNGQKCLHPQSDHTKHPRSQSYPPKIQHGNPVKNWIRNTHAKYKEKIAKFKSKVDKIVGTVNEKCGNIANFIAAGPEWVEDQATIIEEMATNEIDKVVDESKQDVTTGEELEGAKLELKNEKGELVEAWVSGKEIRRNG